MCFNKRGYCICAVFLLFFVAQGNIGVDPGEFREGCLVKCLKMIWDLDRHHRNATIHRSLFYPGVLRVHFRVLPEVRLHDLSHPVLVCFLLLDQVNGSVPHCFEKATSPRTEPGLHLLHGLIAELLLDDVNCFAWWISHIHEQLSHFRLLGLLHCDRGKYLPQLDSSVVSFTMIVLVACCPVAGRRGSIRGSGPSKSSTKCRKRPLKCLSMQESTVFPTANARFSGHSLSGAFKLSC